MRERLHGAVAKAEPSAEPGFAAGAAFVDGRFVPVAEASVPILDWGFLRSDATYDVAHVWRGHFFRLDDHLDRFLRGVDRLHMTLPYDRARIREVVFDCVRISRLRDAYVEVVCTRGIPPSGTRDPRRCTNRFYAFAIPFVWVADPEKQAKGLHLVISGVHRIPTEAVDPTVKNYHWLDLVLGLYDAYDRGGETAVLVDRDGNVTEGPGFNLFAVAGGRIATPDRGVLEGISRRTAIEIAAALGLPVELRSVPAEEVRRADEVFLTSTAGGIIPVARVDGRELGEGRPGPVTLRLRERYWDLHADPRYATPVRYD